MKPCGKCKKIINWQQNVSEKKKIWIMNHPIYFAILKWNQARKVKIYGSFGSLWLNYAISSELFIATRSRKVLLQRNLIQEFERKLPFIRSCSAQNHFNFLLLPRTSLEFERTLLYFCIQLMCCLENNNWILCIYFCKKITIYAKTFLK